MHQTNPAHSTEWKPSVCIDFDGVIHSYERGWQGGHLYGSVVPGFFDWAEQCCSKLSLIIYSSRSGDGFSHAAMREWLELHFNEWKTHHRQARLMFHHFDFRTSKPPALVYIDDRAIKFNGQWDDPALSADAILAFTPWNWPNGKPQP